MRLGPTTLPCLLALLACSPKVGADAGQVPFAQLGPQVAAAACACLFDNDAGAPYCSLADCAAAFPQLGLPTLAAELDGGFIAYDPFAASGCFAATRDFCSQSPLGVPASVASILLQNCQGALNPLRQEGQRCLTDFDCSTGFCFSDAGFCGGTCTALLEGGAACTAAGVPCDPGNGLACRAGECRSGAPVLGDPCLALSDCEDSDLWCNLDAGRCQAPATLGQSCQAQLGGPLAPPCAAPDLWCDQSSGVGTCQALSDAGGPCLPVDLGYGCVPPLTCLPSDAGPDLGVCAPLANDGGACAVEGCADGFVCSDGACVPIPGLGASCIIFGLQNDVIALDQCAAPLACGLYADAGTGGLYNGVCGTAACLGEPCAVGQGACVDGVCSGSCRSPALGDPCEISLDCNSGLCVDGGCADPYACVPG